MTLRSPTDPALPIPPRMYNSLHIPWSPTPSPEEQTYRNAGMVKTKGTLFLLPPSESTLRSSFSSPPRPRSAMSAGAVALCKHFERGGASSEHGVAHPFWTLPTGSNANKDSIAKEILERMLKETIWSNVMLLHPGVGVYEVRNSGGFGIRWTLELEVDEDAKDVVGLGEIDGIEKKWVIKKVTFRGFVEPILGMDHELLPLDSKTNDPDRSLEIGADQNN